MCSLQTTKRCRCEVMQLNISSKSAVALQRVAAYNGVAFEKLVRAVTRDRTPSIRASKLKATVTRLSGDEEFSVALCSQLLSLATLRRVEQISSEELVTGLLAGVESSEKLSSESKFWLNNQRESFVSLFESDSVRFPAKALHLSTDFGHLYMSSNVVTDVRPVFDGDREHIKGAVINQTLRLHYISSGGGSGRVEDELSLAIDIDDIDRMIEELNKAKVKAETSKVSFGEGKQIEIFAVGEEKYGFE